MIGSKINGYKIIDSIGSGAFGHTYKVEKNASIYAMKILKPEAMSSEIQSGGHKRFQREIHALQKVKSDFVVEYYDSGVWIDKDIEHYYILMEFVKGMDFQKYLKKYRREFICNEDLMKDFFSSILRGLQDIHKQKIIHRDLKPANIYITEDSHIKLLDFGLVKMLDYSTITTRGKIVGTPLFMSPEVIEGKEIDFRSDLYSFGVVLYYIYTNEYPFAGDNVFVLLNNIVKNTPKRVSDKFPNISNSLENIIMKLLEKQPYLRPFSSAIELKERIEEIPLLKVDIDLKHEPDKSYDKKKFYIRLLHTEKSELQNYLENGCKVDGIEYPANYLPMYKNQINHLIKCNIPFYFDPSTNRLQFSVFSNTKGLVKLPYVYDKFNRMTPRKLSSIDRIKKYVSDVLGWQLDWDTSFLVAPFHYAETLADEWLPINLKLLEEVFEYKERNNISKEIYAGVCVGIEDLTDEDNRLALVNKYSKILPDGFIFYVNDINEKTTNKAQLYSYIDLLLKFKKLKRPIIAARVGTLGLGLLELGIDAFSQGIASLSSFSKETLLSDRKSGYDVKRKYYIQSLLLCLKINITSEILQNFPEFRCKCRFCKEEYQIDKIHKIAKVHFIEVRNAEIKEINLGKISFVDLAKKAKKNLNIIKKSRYRLPYTQHIDTWIEVFSEFKGGK